MREIIAVTAATGALLFGGANVAQASPAAPQQGPSTVVAQTNDTEKDSDKTGLGDLRGFWV